MRCRFRRLQSTRTQKCGPLPIPQWTTQMPDTSAARSRRRGTRTDSMAASAIPHGPSGLPPGRPRLRSGLDPIALCVRPVTLLSFASYIKTNACPGHCPSGNDPMTSVNDIDCSGVTAAGGNAAGAVGNLCHVDCANRGICDYTSGECTCFPGFYGSNCASLSPVVS